MQEPEKLVLTWEALWERVDRPIWKCHKYWNYNQMSPHRGQTKYSGTCRLWFSRLVVGHSAGRWARVFEVLLQETFISLTWYITKSLDLTFCEEKTFKLVQADNCCLLFFSMHNIKAINMYCPNCISQPLILDHSRSCLHCQSISCPEARFRKWKENLSIK